MGRKNVVEPLANKPKYMEGAVPISIKSFKVGSSKLDFWLKMCKYPGPQIVG